MAEGLDKQIQQYQQRFREFLQRIDDGTFEGDLDKMMEGFNDIPPQLQKSINEQIQTYERSSPSRSVPGFLNFIGRTTANSFLGPVGLSLQDFQNPDRLVDKAKKTALQSVQQGISSNVKNPSVAILNRLNGRGRDDSTDPIYDGRVNKDLIYDSSYKPTSYQDEIKQRYPDESRRLNVIQSNIGNNFYTNYKILHDEENDSELNSGLSEYLIKFHITNNDKILIFRMANFTGITDAISVSYNDVRYFGRPESLKQYDSVARNITFAFDVVVDEESDILPIYKKLDILAGLCYPHKYTSDNIVQPNILKLSIGKYMNKLPFFPTNITYTPDDEMVYSNGKPRLVSVNVTGDIIQPESDPKLNLRPFRRFVGNHTDEQIKESPDEVGTANLPESANNVSEIEKRDLTDYIVGE